MSVIVVKENMKFYVVYLRCFFNPFRLDFLGYHANSADLVQRLQNAASDQDLHCLHTEISVENTVKMKTSTRNS